jgi:hypothetical protein
MSSERFAPLEEKTDETSAGEEAGELVETGAGQSGAGFWQN